MSAPLETEGKWLVQDLPALERKIISLGAACLQQRTYENNLRFDTTGRELSSQYKVLRLRQDTQARFTFKSPHTVENGIRSNVEIEFTVGDAAAAQDFLEALGYEMYFQYEKYRAVYLLEGCQLMLDELPYGDFIEIEGDSPAVIIALAQRLGLAPATSSPLNYAGLFDSYCQRTGKSFQHLTFENFTGFSVEPADLGLVYADHLE